MKNWRDSKSISGTHHLYWKAITVLLKTALCAVGDVTSYTGTVGDICQQFDPGFMITLSICLWFCMQCDFIAETRKIRNLSRIKMSPNSTTL